MDSQTPFAAGISGEIDLLQLALTRAGYDVPADGVFGESTRNALRQLKSAFGLNSDEIIDENTSKILTSFVTGYIIHTIEINDTPGMLARDFGISTDAIVAANPGVDMSALVPGITVTIPLWFDVVPRTIRFTPNVLRLVIEGLTARYPFLGSGVIGHSVMGSPIPCLTIGAGENRVSYNASHHANEWITTPLLLMFLEDYAKALIHGGGLYGIDASALYGLTTLYMIPMVNPDGVTLVTGSLNSGAYYDNAVTIASAFPDIPFPSGWKANIHGVDLNLQYPAGWQTARENKYALGFDRPAPRDFVGYEPLSAPESRAMFDFTRTGDFSLTLSFHTQGEVIYWKYADREPKSSRALAELFSKVSGYAYEETPFASGFAGYKDWFIERYDRPGFTIEAGLGESPLPLSDLGGIYEKTKGIMTLGLCGTAFDF
jgi:g-D-glutamyl-meso-diaminopimelate peptidase